MWTFDRSLTEYENNVPIFIDTIRENKYVQDVFSELAGKLGRPLDSIRNTYASPIFRLGIAYKVNIGRLAMGQVSVSVGDGGVDPEEYRLTESARLFCEGKIALETFFLVNAIRFQALNSTLQRNYFDELARVDHKVLPLLLCLQLLKKLELKDINHSYLTDDELPWLTEQRSHLPADIDNYADQIIHARVSNVPLVATRAASGAYVDAWFKWFHATRVVIDKQQVRIANGVRVRALVLAAERSMITDRILSNPPEFFQIASFDERYKWALEYIKAPSNLEMYLPPKDPLILRVDLPAGALYNATTKELSVPWTIAAGLIQRNQVSGIRKRGTLVALGDTVTGLDKSIVYELVSVMYPGDGSGKMTLYPALKCSDSNKNVSQLIDSIL